jgi:hypothetical protein
MNWRVSIAVISDQATRIGPSCSRLGGSPSCCCSPQRSRTRACSANLGEWKLRRSRTEPLTDQAHVESFFSHVKGDWPNLTEIRDPAALDAELARIRHAYNTVAW